MVEAVVARRVGARQQQRVDLRHAGGHRQPRAVVDVPEPQQRVGLAVVGAERRQLGAVLDHVRDQRVEVLARRALADEQPHALLPPLVRRPRAGWSRGPTRRRRPGRRRAPGPRRPGCARPRAGGRRRRCARASPGRRRSRPGKFMTSATPRAPWRSISSRTSPASRLAPALSNGDAGTQLDAYTPKVNGSGAAASASAAMPGTPSTFAISCGSAATAVVPCGSTVRTNSSIHSLVDSRCMWASTNAGVSALPATSTRSCASRSPQPATTPSAIASSVSTHSRVAGLNTRPPVISRSAGSSPRATAIARGVACGRATSCARPWPRSGRTARSWRGTPRRGRRRRSATRRRGGGGGSAATGGCARPRGARSSTASPMR